MLPKQFYASVWKFRRLAVSDSRTGLKGVRSIQSMSVLPKEQRVDLDVGCCRKLAVEAAANGESKWREWRKNVGIAVVLPAKFAPEA